MRWRPRACHASSGFYSSLRLHATPPSMRRTKWRRPRPGGPGENRGGETTAFGGRRRRRPRPGGRGSCEDKAPSPCGEFLGWQPQNGFSSAVSCLRDTLAAFHVRKPCKTRRSQITSYLWHALRGRTQRLENEAMPRYPAARAADPAFFVGCLVNGGREGGTAHADRPPAAQARARGPKEIRHGHAMPAACVATTAQTRTREAAVSL